MNRINRRTKVFLVTLIVFVISLTALRTLPAFADDNPIASSEQEQVALDAVEDTAISEDEADDSTQGTTDDAPGATEVDSSDSVEPDTADTNEVTPSDDGASPEDQTDAEEADQEDPATILAAPAGASNTEWSIVWKTDDSSQAVDQTRTSTRESSTQDSITAMVTWSPKNLGDGETLAPGDVQIRIPYQFLTDRLDCPMTSGNNSNNARVGVARTVGESGPYYTVEEALENPASDSRGFNWIVERDADGNPTDIVLFNTVEMDKSNGIFTCEINYYYYPSQLTDSKKYELEASTSIAGENVPANGADTLSLTVDTIVTASGQTKEVVTQSVYRENSESARTEPVQSNWLNVWGEAPADADDYVFVPWYIYQRIDSATQAFTVSITDTPTEGRVFAYSDISISSIKSTNWNSVYSFRRNDSDGDTSVPPTRTVNPSMPAEGASNPYWGNLLGYSYAMPQWCSEVVIIGYPKSMLPEDGETLRVTNEVTSTITPLDEVDDPIVQSTTSNAILRDQNFSKLPYDYARLSKYAISDSYTVSQGLTSGSRLEATMLLNDVDAKLRYRIIADGEGYRLTHDGSNGQEAENYGVNPYKLVIYDSVLLIQVDNQVYRLEEGDYEVNKVWLNNENIYSWDFENEVTRARGRTANDSGYEVSYRTGNGAWTKADSSLERYSSSNGIELPEGVTSIMLERTGTDFRYTPSFDLDITVHPTEHVKKILNDARDDGKSYVRFDNVASALLKDKDDKQVDARSYSSLSYLTSTVNAINEELGKDPSVRWHNNYAYFQSPLQDIPRTAAIEKTVSSSDNTTAQSSRLSYTVNLRTPLNIPTDDEEFAKILQERYNTTLDNTVFYDLLPEGVYLDTSTLRAYYRAYTSESGYTRTFLADFDYTLTDNYKGTNRQLLEVRTSIPEDRKDKLITTNSAGRLSVGYGISLSYDADYPWSNALLYGTHPYNVAIAQVEGPELGSGNDANTVSQKFPSLNPIEIDALTNVDGKGGLSSSESSDYYYASRTTTVNFAYAEMAGLNKGIKASVKPSFTSSSSEVPEGTYTYELRYTPEDGTAATNLVFYDVLENAYGDNIHWQANADGGSFQGVSAGQAIKAGVDAKVYYSTEALDPHTQTLDATPDVWKPMEKDSNGSFSLPSGVDPTSVKSLAFDYRKASDGSDYILGAGGTKTSMSPATLTALIYMQAPDRDSIAERKLMPIEGRVPEGYPIFAYNQGVIEMKIAADSSHNFDAVLFRDTNVTTLRLCDPFISIEKLINGVKEYELGTRDEEYEVTITAVMPVQANNDAGQINYSDVSFSDSLPRGMAIDSSTVKVKLAVLDEQGNEDTAQTVSFGFTDADGDYYSEDGTEYAKLQVFDGTDEYNGLGYSDIYLEFPAEVARRFESRILTISFKARVMDEYNPEDYRGDDDRLVATNTAEGKIANNSKFNGEDSADIIIPDLKVPALVKQVKVNDGSYDTSQDLPSSADVITYKVSTQIPYDGSDWKLSDTLVDELELINPDKATITITGTLRNLSQADEKAFEEQYREKYDNNELSSEEYYRLYYAAFSETSFSRTFSPAEWNSLNSFYSSFTKTDSETGETTEAFAADFASTGFSVEIRNSAKGAIYNGINDRRLWALFNGSFETQTDEETGEQTLVFTTPQGTMNSYRDDETGEWIYDDLYPTVSYKSSIAGMTMTVEFDAKLKEDASLSKYIQADGSVVIPNVAVSSTPSFSSASSNSNEATLVTKLPVVKKVEGVNNATLDAGKDSAAYSIMAEVPSYAAEAVITDQLDEALSLKGGTGKVLVTDESGAPVAANVDYKDRLITVTVEQDALSARTGTKITVSFEAKIDTEADLSTYEGGAIPNVAGLSIDGGPTLTSNVVTVVPTAPIESEPEPEPEPAPKPPTPPTPKPPKIIMPRTGDDTNIGAIVGIGCVAIVALAVAYFLRKRAILSQDDKQE